MYTTYHLISAQEVNSDLLDAIKATFKSRPITIIVEADEDVELSIEKKIILDERLEEDENTTITGEESIRALKTKYGL